MKEQDWLLSWSRLSIVFYQQKVSKNEMLKQLRVRANVIYQSNFLKVAVSNHSSKGAMTGSFRRAHFP